MRPPLLTLLTNMHERLLSAVAEFASIINTLDSYESTEILPI
jgi:hypothetical protein